MVISVSGEASCNNETNSLIKEPKESEASEVNCISNNSTSGQSTSQVNNSKSGQSTTPIVNESSKSSQSTRPIVNSSKSGQNTSQIDNSSKSGQSTSQIVNSSKSGQSTNQVVNSSSNYGQSTTKVVNVSNISVVVDIEEDNTEFSSQDSTPVQGSESPDISEFSSPLTRSVSSDGFEIVTRKRPKKRVMVPSQAQLYSAVSKPTKAVPNLPNRKGKPQPQPWLS
ncbi:hybrid signal transduction histidine kinase L-like [Stylophora pistillata]|uniref:hybrid signal transduction histidine kinase L-like n=1 Tax=Stylophora pistillata TaxID=50429 RepID=UPI000C050BF9|nr:hybrid signal transduction histidine kinase L-like [Stylophora pistillata]